MKPNITNTSQTLVVNSYYGFSCSESNRYDVNKKIEEKVIEQKVEKPKAKKVNHEKNKEPKVNNTLDKIFFFSFSNYRICIG